MGAAIYYQPTHYNPQILLNWYNSIKRNADCPICEKHYSPAFYKGYNLNIEFHHIDRSLKIDTLSNMVWQRAPLGAVMAEMLKCTPLCHTHHKRLHNLEAQGMLKNSIYDLHGDDYYQSHIECFHEAAWDNAPEKMKTAYTEWVANAFEITKQETSPRNFECYASPKLPNGALR